MSLLNPALILQRQIELNCHIAKIAMKMAGEVNREFLLTMRAYQVDGPKAVVRASLEFNKRNKGGGQPVLVFPGFCASDLETILLRAFLNARGYEAHGWEQGRNFGLNQETLDQASDRVKKLSDEYSQAVKVVGWSLGSLISRYIANENPFEVGTVATVGGPANKNAQDGEDVLPWVKMLYEFLNGPADSPKNIALLEQALQPMQQPLSAIITEDDLIVHKEAAIPDTPNGKGNFGPQEVIQIEREAGVTHCGLVAHPLALDLIEDRLSEDPDDWHPIDAATNKLGRHKHVQRLQLAA